MAAQSRPVAHAGELVAFRRAAQPLDLELAQQHSPAALIFPPDHHHTDKIGAEVHQYHQNNIDKIGLVPGSGSVPPAENGQQQRGQQRGQRGNAGEPAVAVVGRHDPGGAH